MVSKRRHRKKRSKSDILKSARKAYKTAQRRGKLRSFPLKDFVERNGVAKRKAHKKHRR